MLAPHMLTLLVSLSGTLAAPQGCHGSDCRTRLRTSASTSASTAKATDESEGVWSNSTGVPEDQGPDAIVTNNLAESAASTTDSASSAVTARSSSSAGGEGAGSRNHWKPSMSDTIVVDLENRPIPSSDASVYVVDMAHTAEQIQAYHDEGKKVVCYFSAGAWDTYRDDKTEFLPQCYCGTGDVSADAEGNCADANSKQEAWNAWWFDLMTPECVDNVKQVLEKRIVAIKDKGCDGIDPDNVDSFQNDVIYGNDEAAQLSFNLWLAETAHANGLAIDLKNAGSLLQVSDDYKTQLVDAFDFNVIESCHVYDCSVYQPFLDADKPQIQLEYAELYSTDTCDPPKEGVGMLLYPNKLVDSGEITLTCYA